MSAVSIDQLASSQQTPESSQRTFWQCAFGSVSHGFSTELTVPGCLREQTSRIRPEVGRAAQRLPRAGSTLREDNAAGLRHPRGFTLRPTSSSKIHCAATGDASPDALGETRLKGDHIRAWQSCGPYADQLQPISTFLNPRFSLHDFRQHQHHCVAPEAPNKPPASPSLLILHSMMPRLQHRELPGLTNCQAMIEPRQSLRAASSNGPEPCCVSACHDLRYAG